MSFTLKTLHALLTLSSRASSAWQDGSASCSLSRRQLLRIPLKHRRQVPVQLSQARPSVLQLRAMYIQSFHLDALSCQSVFHCKSGLTIWNGQFHHTKKDFQGCQLIAENPSIPFHGISLNWTCKTFFLFQRNAFHPHHHKGLYHSQALSTLFADMP